MDISKLPKFSKRSETDNPAIPENVSSQPDPASPPLDYRIPAHYSEGIGADVWFTTVIAVLLLFFGRTFGSYLLARATGHSFHTNVFWTDGERNGQEVSYPDLEGRQMLSDAGVFFFGLILLLDAGIKVCYGLNLRLPRALRLSAFLLAVASTAFNLFVSLRLMADGTLPLLSGLAVAFGGYIVFDMWRIAKSDLQPLAQPNLPAH